MKKFIAIFTFFSVVYLVSSFLLIKETHAATTNACVTGSGTCFLPGNCVSGSTESTDSFCGVGFVCCVPSAGETKDTCGSAGGFCLYSCLAPSTNEGIKSDCGTGQTCCVPTIAAETEEEKGGLGGLVQCGTGDTPDASTECDFAAFMSLIQRVINFMLFVIALPLAALSFAYAGILYTMTPVADKRSEAKNIFLNVVKGLLWAFIAWLLIHAIVAGFGVSESYNFLGS